MERDPQKDNIKCSLQPINRQFKLTGANAKETTCREKCAEEYDCVAMSGIWGSWCIGCKEMLSAPHVGAKAFTKGMYFFFYLSSL